MLRLESELDFEVMGQSQNQASGSTQVRLTREGVWITFRMAPPPFSLIFT